MATALIGLLLSSCAAGGDAESTGAAPGPNSEIVPSAPVAEPSEPVAEPSEPAIPAFAGSIGEIAAEQMPHSWRPGCPVPVASLRLLTLNHWDFDGNLRTGELVVHRDHAANLLGVMESLFNERFPIERMELIDKYQGDDDLSMAANNTSAFNCRSVIGRPGVWSQHTYGWAIDINPVQNPYLGNGKVLPPAGESYRDRTNSRPGMIVGGDPVFKAFFSIGWKWGGEWTNPKDYQHFSATGG